MLTPDNSIRIGILPRIFILCLFLSFITNINAQKTFQIGFNLNPTYSFSQNSNNDTYFKLRGNINYRTGINISYFFSNKYALSTGANLVKNSFTIYQSNFDGLATGFIKHIPTFHTLQIPLLFIYKQPINDKFFVKYSCGITFDYNNFDTYKIHSNFNQTSDTLFTYGLYNFKSFSGNSILASIKFISFYNETGSYEIGISYNHTLNKFPSLGVLTNVGSNSYSFSMSPRLSYIGVDFCFSPYYGQSFKKAFSFRKPSIYLFILQSIIIASVVL